MDENSLIRPPKEPQQAGNPESTSPENPPNNVKLSDLERRILALLADGREDVNIAYELRVRPRTVKDCIRKIGTTFGLGRGLWGRGGLRYRIMEKARTMGILPPEKTIILPESYEMPYLTPTELKVVKLLGRDPFISNEGIAEALSFETQSVKNYTGSIFKKFGLDRSSAARFFKALLDAGLEEGRIPMASTKKEISRKKKVAETGEQKHAREFLGKLKTASRKGVLTDGQLEFHFDLRMGDYEPKGGLRSLLKRAEEDGLITIEEIWETDKKTKQSIKKGTIIKMVTPELKPPQSPDSG